MIVCVCEGVNEAKLHHAVANGCTTLRALRCALGVASRCGKCGPEARECLRAALRASSARA